jgi:hypothetical protein
MTQMVSSANSQVNLPFVSNPRWKIGDEVWTNFSGHWTQHTITKVLTDRISQTGVSYKVTPALGNNWADAYDEGWFRASPFSDDA